jgi:hypothetical protein
MHEFCYSVIETNRELHSMQATTECLNMDCCFGNYTL